MMDMVDAERIEVGWLADIDEAGRPLVGTDSGCAGGFEVAWLGMELTQSQVVALAQRRQRVLLVRPAGLAGASVIIGVLRERGLDEPPTPRELVLEASERLIVRCGGARIVLGADGGCEVQAERISQRARGIHAIKGAAVRIN